MTTKFGWLEFFAEVFEGDVADGGGEDGDGKVLDGEDVVQSDGEGFARAVGTAELSHQEVGIEKKDDERDFNYCSTELAEPTVFSVLMHG